MKNGTNLSEIFFCFIRIKKPSRFVKGIYDTFNDSELEYSDGDDDDVECEFEQQKRIRVGSHILTIDDEQFVEGDSEDEDFEGFPSNDLLLNVNTNKFAAGTSVENEWKYK